MEKRRNGTGKIGIGEVGVIMETASTVTLARERLSNCEGYGGAELRERKRSRVEALRSGVKGHRLRQERRRGVDRIEEGKLEQMRWFYRGCNYLLKGVLVG